MAHRHVSVDGIAYRSGLNKWNPAWKVIFTLIVIISVISFDSVVISVFTFGYMSYLILAKGKTGLSEYIHFLLVPFLFVIVGTVAIVLQFGNGTGRVMLSVPLLSQRLYITQASVRQGIGVFTKAFSAMSGLYFLSLSTPMGELIEVGRKAHVPDILLELMYFIYRFFFWLIEISRKQTEAVASRLGYVDMRTSFKSFASTSANLLVMAIRRSGEFYDAIESRGYDGRLIFLTEEKGISKDQIFYMVSYIFIIVILEMVVLYGK